MYLHHKKNGRLTTNVDVQSWSVNRSVNHVVFCLICSSRPAVRASLHAPGWMHREGIFTAHVAWVHMSHLIYEYTYAVIWLCTYRIKAQDPVLATEWPIIYTFHLKA
jgi:hypothetical protein